MPALRGVPTYPNESRRLIFPLQQCPIRAGYIELHSWFYHVKKKNQIKNLEGEKINKMLLVMTDFSQTLVGV